MCVSVRRVKLIISILKKGMIQLKVTFLEKIMSVVKCLHNLNSTFMPVNFNLNFIIPSLI